MSYNKTALPVDVLRFADPETLQILNVQNRSEAMIPDRWRDVGQVQMQIFARPLVYSVAKNDKDGVLGMTGSPESRNREVIPLLSSPLPPPLYCPISSPFTDVLCSKVPWVTGLIQW